MPAKKKPAKKTAKKPTKKTAKKTPKKKVSAIPGWYQVAVMPTLTVSDANAAIDWYTKAFGAKQRGGRMTDPSGKVMHAEFVIGGLTLMINDEIPGMAQSAHTLGGSPVNLMMYSKNVDATVAKATAAGAKLVMPVADQFWGDRYGVVMDPFGIKWSIATHTQDLTPKQMMVAMAADMAARGSQAA